MPNALPNAAPSRAPDAVSVATLSIKDLRNYAALNAAFGARVVVFAGPNGAGKTNLLEAISLLTPGRGLRRAGFEEITRRGATTGWAVAATLRRNGAETRLGTGLVAGRPGEPPGRRVRVNGATAAGADVLRDHLRLRWRTPAMDGLLTGPAGERRRFLDRLVLTVDARHARRARDFERLLTQRNRLLEERAEPRWLDAVEAELAAQAVAIGLARAETAALLSARIERQAGDAPAFPVGRIALDGEFDRAIAGRSAAESEAWFQGVLARARPADRAAGRTLQGPHRSDLGVALAAKDMPAALSSTGEQKALLIGLVLAHAELVAEVCGMTPVLLLDEVAAHLDPDRRAGLFARLAALGCQAFLTGTDPTLFADLPADAELFHLVDGRLGRAR